MFLKEIKGMLEHCRFSYMYLLIVENKNDTVQCLLPFGFKIQFEEGIPLKLITHT